MSISDAQLSERIVDRIHGLQDHLAPKGRLQLAGLAAMTGMMFARLIETKRETIVAAALRVPVPAEYLVETWRGNRVYPDHLIVSAPPPARHGSLLHPLHTLGIRVGPDDQGFVTNTGRFVERAEALKIALAANQTFRPDGPYKDHGGSELFSEDLW